MEVFEQLLGDTYIARTEQDEMEACYPARTKISSMDENFRKHLDNMLCNYDDVLFNWTMITGGKTNNEEMLHEIIKLWITTRGFSFAKSIMEKYRSSSKKRTAKSKGLRTKLYTDQV